LSGSSNACWSGFARPGYNRANERVHYVDAAQFDEGPPGDAEGCHDTQECGCDLARVAEQPAAESFLRRLDLHSVAQWCRAFFRPRRNERCVHAS